MMTFQINQPSMEGILKLLAQLPTSSGAYPLLVDLQAQFDAQAPKEQATPQLITE